LPGHHPEAEMNHYLTDHGFTHAPSLLGDVVRIAPDGTPSTLAVLLQFVRNEGDAWSWILDHLSRAIDAHAPAVTTEASGADLFADCDAIVVAIGRRLGEMHAVLALDTNDPAFAPERASAADAVNWAKKAEERLQKAFETIALFKNWERPSDRERAQKLLGERDDLIAAVHSFSKWGAGTLKTRIHGDFHLGQVLVASGDIYIIDFEGEPAISITERRAKASPLRDIAGLLRSIDYAAAAMIESKAVNAVPLSGEQRDRLLSNFRSRSSTIFINAYCDAIGALLSAAERSLLNLFLIEKAAYELNYETANRPSWIRVPLDGLLRLAGRLSEKAFGGQDA
jgi:maltose alpha-D-glucosyltransferase / alpha-amylase